ncbi:MAG: ABC transporter ATP-binding protein [Candidatus Humimicrobiaceae bacterium]
MNDTRPIKVNVVNLNKNFNDLKVLQNVSFNIRKGEFVCVVGPTGCGKTTFLNLLTKLQEPTSGDIFIDGKKANPKEHNIAFIFQESSTFPWLNVEKNISFGMEIKKYPAPIIKKNVEKMLDLIGLKQFRYAYPSQLSVSSEQKAAIGRAFVLEPDLLLMDEPYGQMDIKTRFFLEDEVLKMWKKLGTTVIFITHNIEEAVYLAERILILSQKPASIKEELIVDLPRPRDVSSPEFVEIRKYVTNKIKWW